MAIYFIWISKARVVLVLLSRGVLLHLSISILLAS